MCHVSGVSNRISDFLSRFHLHSSFQNKFYEETEGLRKEQCVLTDDLFDFVNVW